MSIIHKYLIANFLKFFCIIQFMVICIFIVIDYIESIDRFIKSGVGIKRAFTYVLLKTPFMGGLLTPVCIVLSVLVLFGLMNKNNEILALKSSGISIYYLLKPFLMTGFILSILLFILNETIVPVTMSAANKIKQVELKKKTLLTSSGKNIWIKHKNLIIYIKFYNPEHKTIFGVTLNYLDDNFKLIKRLDAKTGFFIKDKWHLYDTIELKLNKENGYDAVIYEEQMVFLNFEPKDLKNVIKKSEEMGFFELYSYIKKVESEGYDASIYKVDLHSKIAFPFVCMIMCMVGTSIAIMDKFRDRLALLIASGIFISFIYWTLYSLSLSMGYGGMLPPIICAWIPNIIFFCFASFTLLNAE